MPNLVVSAVTKYDGKGLAKGRKDINAFQKTVGNLAKTFVGLYSATKLAQFGKSSVKAFLADDKAAKALGKTLDNTGNSFAKVGVEKFIQSLQRQTGVLDDQLRPAFQQLLVATGSVTKAQEGLSVALDVAAGTSSDVESVTKAISKAYAGNTTALTKLIPGIDKAVLASKDLNAINKELTRLFGGQAAVAAGTYAGQLDILEASAADAKETIGKGLVTAIELLSKGQSLDKATSKMDALATSIADVTVGLADAISKLEKNLGGARLQDLFFSPILTPIVGALQKGGKTIAANKAAGAPVLDPKQLIAQDKAAKAKAAADKKALDAAKKLAALTKKAEMDKLALKKAGSVFDLEQIQIQAALKYGIDEQTRLRLLLQKALLENDVNEAIKLTGLLNENETKTKELANLLATLPKADDPFADWPGIIANINRLMKDLRIPGGAAAALAGQGLTIDASGKGVVDTGAAAAAAAAKAAADAKKIADDIAKAWADANATATAAAAAAAAKAAADAAAKATADTVSSAAAKSEIDFNNFLNAVTAGGDSGFAGAARRAGNPDPMGTNVYVTVNAGVVGSEQVIAQEVQNAISFLSRSGGLIGYAGQIAV